MINKLLSRWGYERKESRTAGLTTLGLGQPVWTPREYADLAKAGYMLNADIYTAVNLVAGAAKQVRLFVSQTEGGEAVTARRTSQGNTAGDLAYLLNTPNPRSSSAEFVERAISFFLLSGNRYIERVGADQKNPLDPPRELWVIRSDRMAVLKGTRTNPVQGFRFTAENGKTEDFAIYEILHQKSFHPLNDWYGMSPLEAAGYPIDLSNEASALFKKLLQKGYPAGWIETDEDWTPNQISDFRRGLAKRAKENDWILAPGIKGMHALGFDVDAAKIIDGKVLSKRDIAAVFRVPPEMMGDTNSKTFSNFREARKSLYTEAAIPELVLLVDGLNRWLSPLFQGAWVNIDRDSIDALAEDRDVAAARAQKIFVACIVKRNEARAEMGFEAVPESENKYYNELPKPLQQQALAASGSNNRDTEKSEAIEPVRSAYEFKAFDLFSDQAREVYWKRFDSERSRFFKQYEQKFADQFDDERRAVLFAFRQGQERDALIAVDGQSDEWEKVYRDLYLEVSKEFGDRVIRGFKSDALLNFDTKATADIFTRAILQWLSTEGAKRVVGVTSATKDQIKKELIEGVKAGETMFELSRRLESMYASFKDYRAERIARTEVIGASNLGSHVAAAATNIPLEKEWLATFDNRTRSPHRHADGQKRDMSTPFDVMGQRLMFPGDSSLGATGDNIIQCRCTTSYRIKRA